MSTIKFLQGDCLEWMNKISKKGKVVDVVLTSPPYNTSRPNKSDSSLKNHEGSKLAMLASIEFDKILKDAENNYQEAFYDKVYDEIIEGQKPILRLVKK